MTDLKLEDALQLSKIYSYFKEKSEDEKVKKTVKIILICVGAVTVLAAAAYVLYRLMHKYDDNDDLYDDLDYYYDDEEKSADGDAEGAETECKDTEEANDEDFAE